MISYVSVLSADDKDHGVWKVPVCVRRGGKNRVALSPVMLGYVVLCLVRFQVLS